MAIKKRKVEDKAVEKLADDLADKPYGDEGNEEQIVRTSFSLPVTMQQSLEDLAIKNKRTKRDLKTVSAIVRVAIGEYLKHNS